MANFLLCTYMKFYVDAAKIILPPLEFHPKKPKKLSLEERKPKQATQATTGAQAHYIQTTLHSLQYSAQICSVSCT